MRKRENTVISFEFNDDVQKKRRPWAFIYDWLDSFIYAIVIIFVIFTFGFRLVGVNGTSMNPTLQHGDWLTVNAVPTKVEKGDIVVITQPNYLNEPIIKRVIAKGGDTVDIDFIEHTVKVNDLVLYEPYIAEPTANMGDYVYPMTVPEGCVFVMGDNRNDSLDSRFKSIGFIDERYILGKVGIRLFPIGDWNVADEKSKCLNTVYDFTSVLVTAIIVVAAIFTFVFKISAISGESMENTLHHNDRVLISAVPDKIKYGDIVIISQPNDYNKVLIKRVIAVEGQTVSFDTETGKTLVDGVAIDEPYIKEPMDFNYSMLQKFTVPKGCLFVMGDNRNWSADSRDAGIGFIDRRYVVGKVICKIGEFKHINHNFKESKNAG